jgi:pimeloyl-ACP methyl ester carboxylesterase
MLIETERCRFSYDRSGSGPPVVLIHGLGGSRLLWRRVVAELAGAVDAIAIDLRGAGATHDPLSDSELTLEVWAHDLTIFLDALAIQRPVVVGHSLGACVALVHAMTRTSSAAGLVLVNGDANLASLGPRVRRSIEAITKVGFARWVEEHWAKSAPPLSAHSLDRAPDLLDEYRAMLEANAEHNYLRFCRAIAGAPDLRPRLNEINAPTIVVAGSDDNRSLPVAARNLATLVAGAEYVEIRAVGHTAPMEAPAEVAAAICRVVERNGGAGARRSDS